MLVESGARRFGLASEVVAEIIRVEQVLSAPALQRAVRGVLQVRERLVPLVHLAALLDDGDPPAVVSDTAVLVTGAGRQIALEVDVTSGFMREETQAVPPAWDVPWAAGVARHDGALVPVVDLDVLVERLRLARTGAST